MAIVTEEIEVAYCKAYLLCPERSIPILHTWDIGTHQCCNSKEYQHHTGVDIHLEFSFETVIHCSLFTISLYLK